MGRPAVLCRISGGSARTRTSSAACPVCARHDANPRRTGRLQNLRLTDAGHPCRRFNVGLRGDARARRVRCSLPHPIQSEAGVHCRASDVACCGNKTSGQSLSRASARPPRSRRAKVPHAVSDDIWRAILITYGSSSTIEPRMCGLALPAIIRFIASVMASMSSLASF